MAACLRDVTRVLPNAEVIVVAGGNDATEQIAAAFALGNSRMSVIRQKGQGKGGAIRDALAVTKAGIIAQFDTDAQFSADDLGRAVDVVRAGTADVCVGSRFMGDLGDPHGLNGWTRLAGNGLLSRWVGWLLGRRCTDVTSGLKVWRAQITQDHPFKDNGYCYELELIIRAHRAGAAIMEIPVVERPRAFGQSMHRNVFHLAVAGVRLMAYSAYRRFDKMDLSRDAGDWQKGKALLTQGVPS